MIVFLIIYLPGLKVAPVMSDLALLIKIPHYLKLNGPTLTAFLNETGLCCVAT